MNEQLGLFASQSGAGDVLSHDSRGRGSVPAVEGIDRTSIAYYARLQREYYERGLESAKRFRERK